MNFQDIIQSEFDKMSSDGAIEDAIRSKAREVITKSINEAFNSWSGMGKQLADSVEGALKLDFSQVDLDEYNVMISQMVKRVAFEHLEERAQSVLIERLEGLLGAAPKEITVQGIVDKYIEYWKDYDCPCSGEAHIEIKTSDWSDTSTTIKLWKEQPTGTYSKPSPDVDIYVSDNKICIPRLDATKWPTRSGFSIESEIYQMFCAGTLITDAHTVHADDVSVSYHD